MEETVGRHVTKATETDICDSHFHVFGPPEQFPIVATSKYQPPVVSIADYERVFAPLGVRRMVLIQPSCYGTDNRYVLESMASLGDRARAVVAISPDISAAELQAMHEAGARGIRLNAVNGSTVSRERLRDVVRKLKPLGWHLQVHVPAGLLPTLADDLLDTGLTVVIDHFGTLDPRQGLEQPTFRTLTRMLETGHCWVKLSAPFRISKSVWPYADMVPFARALLELRSDRMVWGSDWPYIHFIDKVPPDYNPLQLLQEAIADQDALKAVLSDNSRQLYDFGADA
jgi:predicted TIM-barrel fold metal-dependent hydrolase